MEPIAQSRLTWSLDSSPLLSTPILSSSGALTSPSQLLFPIQTLHFGRMFSWSYALGSCFPLLPLSDLIPLPIPLRALFSLDLSTCLWLNSPSYL